jgi:ATP-dependent helicase HrpA
MSEMVGMPFGGMIGCQTRLDKDFGPDTVIKVCTDGILLQELKGDPDLSKYGMVIVDEAHERSLNIDLILGLLIRLRERRPDLRILVTSATIERERFQKFFDLTDEQVVTVPGRLFPVNVIYRDPLDRIEEGEGLEADDDVALWAARAVEAICRDRQPGDILVFMPRVKEIRGTIQELESKRLPGVQILPMHGRQTPQENGRVFESGALRKIIVATNIAETSITVPGIRFVVDSGRVNEKRFDPKIGITSLFPVTHSVSSSDQRAGRAGRVEDGVCIRLWTEEEHEARRRYTQPEILRSDLVQLVLLMRDLGIERIREFPFLDRPEPQRLYHARQTLIDVGALTPEDELTDMGRRMARLPLDPRLARMVLAAVDQGCLDEVLTVAACLSVSREPFLAPRLSERGGGGVESHRQAVRAAKEKLADGGSDFDALRALYDGYRRRKWKERRTYCEEHRASLAVLEEIVAVRKDLEDAVRRGGVSISRGPRSVSKKERMGIRVAVAKSILAGLVAHVAVRDGKYEYVTAGRVIVFIHPGSLLFTREKRPQVIVAHALEEGENRTFARGVAGVPPGWLEEVVPHLVSTTHREKRFDPQTGKVTALENVYFRELTLQQDVRVDLFDRDEEEAVRVLVRDGLLADRLGLGLAFREENEGVLDEVRRLSDRIGDRSLIPDEDQIVAFYARKLAGCRDGQSVVRRVGRHGESGLLRMELADFVGPEELKLAAELFPEQVTIGGKSCPVSYVHNPWNGRTTITIQMDQQAFEEASSGEAERAVPGWLSVQERGEGSMHLQLQVVGPGGEVRAEGATQASLARSLGQDQIREAWSVACERYEISASEQFHEVPRLLEGICEPVVVCMDPGEGGAIEGWPGLAREGYGFARRLFRNESESVTSTREGLCEYVRLLQALRAKGQEDLSTQERISEDLEIRFEKVTGRPRGFGEVFEEYLFRIASGGFLSVEELRGGGEVLLKRLEEQRSRAIRAIEETLPVLDDAVLACLTLRKRLAGKKVASEWVDEVQGVLSRCTESLREFDQQPPEGLEELQKELRQWTRKTKPN